MSDYQRSKSDKGGKGDIVDREVRAILKKKNATSADWLRLRQKYEDDQLVDRIQDGYMEILKKAKKNAKKFAHHVFSKYSNRNYPLHKLLRKAIHYKEKYNLSDAEFEEFSRIYKQILAGSNSKEAAGFEIPRTNMGNILGYPAQDLNDGGITASASDYPVLESIKKTYAATRSLHAQVLLQSLTYSDCSYEAMTGNFNRDKHNPSCHIHPVIAALFLPKIQILEETMILSNMANIVKNRLEGTTPSTKPDYILYYNLITDPNDIVCNESSPVQDLHARVQMQQKLWKAVHSLRTGSYYDCDASQFLAAVDQCKLNEYDNPDLIYAGHENVILRRILGAFSLRPTVVATTPLYGNVGSNPFGNSVVRPKVTTVPLITLRLPLNPVQGVGPVQLEDAFEQAQWFLRDNNVVPEHQSIIYSRQVMFFTVNRRAHSIRTGLYTQPYQFATLPPVIHGFERLNDREVNFKYSMDVRGDIYKLRSVVCADINSLSEQAKNYIVGCSTIFMKHPAVTTSGVQDQEFFLYDPRGASVVVSRGAGPESDKPITVIGGFPDGDPNGVESFYERASQRGTIFVYAVENKGEGIYPFN